MRMSKVLFLAMLLMAIASPANACGDCEPGTMITIEASEELVCEGQEVTLTICEENIGDVPLDDVYVQVFVDDAMLDTLDRDHPEYIGGDEGNIGVLDVGEKWCWFIVYAVNDETTFTAIGHGFDLQGNDVTLCENPEDPPEGVVCDQLEYYEVTVETYKPDTRIDIKANDSDGPITVCEGDQVTLTICEENTGEVDLTDVWVRVNANESQLFDLSAPPDSGDAFDPGVLNVGETWCWTVVRTVAIDTMFEATGHGLDPAGNDITPENGYDSEFDEVYVKIKSCDGAAGCRVTAGGVTAEMVYDGAGIDRATFGGQAGANTALPPQPKGEWTHTQQKGPSGSFTFHGGTASAPAGTEIIEIRCSDPGGCKPGDPPSPAKQLDFDGVGTFKNFGTKKSAPAWLFEEANARCSSKGDKHKFDGTFHYFQVNIDDIGEPGNKNLDAASDPDTCPPNGFGEKGDLELANCECADFYRITIYDGVDAAGVVWLDENNIDLNSLNTTDVIYEFHGYIDGGNLQIHHLTGYDKDFPDNNLVSLNELAKEWLEGV